MAEPMLRAVRARSGTGSAHFDRYPASADPWLRAAAPMIRCSFARMLRPLRRRPRPIAGPRWPRSASWASTGERRSALIQLAEFAKLRADHAATVAALQEAAAFGRELAAWGDLIYIDGLLAAVRPGWATWSRPATDLEQAERAQAERSMRLIDAGAWLAHMRAELHWQEGDLAAAAAAAARRCWPGWTRSSRRGGTGCARLVGQAGHGGLRQGDRDALPRAARRRAGHGRGAGWNARRWPTSSTPSPCSPCSPAAGPAERRRAATLLGAAHTIRGAFDESSLDAPRAREAARAALLGEAGFDAAYERGRDLAGERGDRRRPQGAWPGRQPAALRPAPAPVGGPRAARTPRRCRAPTAATAPPRWRPGRR